MILTWTRPLKHTLCILAAMIALHLGVVAASAQEEGGVVEGRVVNGTSGAEAPGAAVVTLYAFRDFERSQEWSMPVDEQAGFRFEGLPDDPEIVFLAVADYQGVVYPHKGLVRLPEQGSAVVELTVFETTSEANLVFAPASMLVSSLDENQAAVIEMGAVVNPSDRTYVGGDNGVLRLGLPVGARNVTAQSGLVDTDLTVTDGLLISHRPIPPGRHQIAVSYSIPVAGPVLDLGKRLYHPAESMNLFLPYVQGIEASSPQLLAQGGQPPEMGGQRFQVYSSQNLPAGTEVVVRVTGMAHGMLTPELMAGLGLAGTVAVGGGVWFALRRRAQAPLTSEAPAEDPGWSMGPSRQEGAQSTSPLELERQRLVTDLARLDVAFSSGELPEEEYRRRREERKQQLLALVRQVDAEVSAGS